MHASYHQAMSATLASWLQEELPRRGYPLGPRRGGSARFAEEAGINASTFSRILSGASEPTLDNLRRIGQPLGRSLGQMLVIAGAATAAELTALDQPGWYASPPEDLWPGEDWESLPEALRWLWHTPSSSPRTRKALAGVYLSLEQAETPAPAARQPDPQQDSGAQSA